MRVLYSPLFPISVHGWRKPYGFEAHCAIQAFSSLQCLLVYHKLRPCVLRPWTLTVCRQTRCVIKCCCWGSKEHKIRFDRPIIKYLRRYQYSNVIIERCLSACRWRRGWRWRFDGAARQVFWRHPLAAACCPLFARCWCSVSFSLASCLLIIEWLVYA